MVPMAPEHISPGLGHQLMTHGTISLGLVPQPPSPTPDVPPTKNDWDSVFCPMFDEYFNPSPSVAQPVLVAVVQEPVVSTGTPSSTRIDHDTPYSTSQITQKNNLILLDYKIQQLSKGSSEGYGNTPEVPDEPKDNSSSSNSINGDVSIHQADLCVQRITSLTLLISMVTEKDSINTTPPTHMLMFNAQLLLDKTFHEELLRGVLERVVGARTNSDGQKDVLVAYDLIHT
ncbi:hypothetical protein Tco_1125193 [Tanacetum coccineum]|uniref:Uncharacterized protein n=1 Tax=Tanacetum coccineum TaxID=301880 RepID=A0ABQ5JBB4_9ASTR